MKLVCISDTHGFHRDIKLPPGDVLIHAGDITGTGEMHVVEDFAAWLSEQDFACKIVVPGNHDFCFDISRTKYDGGARRAIEAAGAELLIDRAITVDGLKFYGSPWVPNLASWAFYDRDRDMFESAPKDIDILVTHGPPRGVRDSLWKARLPSVYMAWGDEGADHVGSSTLLHYVRSLPKLKAHIFGHVHEGYGLVMDDPMFVNAAICTRLYEPTNRPITIEVGP